MDDLNKKEEDILRYWEENKVLELAREANRGRKPFYFLDGPPFVTGDLHPGQMWVKAMKDVVLRYKRLKGFDVYAKAGYDVHGLPVEKKVEASLKVTNKKEIETAIGIDRFIRSCKEYVEGFIGRMDSDYARFGISLDFKNAYLPSRKPYMEIEWQFLKVIHDKGLLYKSLRSTAYCKGCQTAVSQGGTEIVYRDDEDPSVLVAFRIDASKKSGKIALSGEAYLLVWTTTPWTLPANMAIAAHSKEPYVLAKLGERRLIFAKSRLDFVSGALNASAVVEAEFYGSELDGIAYLSPLEPKVGKQREFRKYHRVVMAEELVTASEGTGLVHIAPGHGLEDYLVGKRCKLPVFSPVDEAGRYTSEAGAYKGLEVPEEANAAVLSDLKELGALMHSATTHHSYPHCWRCDTKLIYIATEQWFINIQRIKRRLIRANERVAWHPAEAGGWEEELLRSSPDWIVSRQRYWGTPMPIWTCGCGETKVIGSVAELRENAVDKEYVGSLTDLHRDHVDNILLRCGACGKEMHRISDVLDVWFDSGVAYRASLTQEEFDRLFPVDFILEGVDQLRGWFASQLKMGTLISGRSPFRNVGLDGMMLGPDGREMHKKLGNYVALSEILKSTTADSFRLWCTSHVPETDLVFSIEGINEANRTIVLLYNIANLYNYYADAVGYRPKKVKRSFREDALAPEDRWIYMRMNAAIRIVTWHLDRYEMHKAAMELRSFITGDFSRFYLRIAKKRLLYGGRKRAKVILDLINYLLFNTLVIISPFTPFASERIYLDVYGEKKSISLNRWPGYASAAAETGVLKEFGVALEAITALLHSREHEGLKLRQPLIRATIETANQEGYDAILKLSPIIEEYVNVKKLEVRIIQEVSLTVRPSFQKLGPEFKESASAVAEALRSANVEEMQREIEKSGHYQLHTDKGTFAVTGEHFTVISRAAKENAVPFRYGIAYVDSEISRELREEAVVREFEHGVQMARRELGLRKPDRIELKYQVNGEVTEIIRANWKRISRDVNACSLSEGAEQGWLSKEINVEDEKIRISVRKA
jgi:isoleucyl-tRNA synthetase